MTIFPGLLESQRPQARTKGQLTMESLSEHFALFYYLLQCLGSSLGLLLITIGIPGQFLPGIIALVFWLFGIEPSDEAIQTRGIEALVLLGLAILAEIIEFLSGLIGGRTAGSSRRGAVGAILGGFLGGVIGNLMFPLIGGLIGILMGTGLGAFVGEWSAQSKSRRQQPTVEGGDSRALKVGFASMIGRAVGLIAKLALAMCCFLYCIVALIRELW
ncbi:MAG: hypothetical protein COB10_06540 [Planctomycetota bacterium]|nr:MAG: hypothetical protein COB10_06540 [Planctomycetota bacterium]HIC23701.1 DUF456 domain-containing protein [Planctomycetota bacterium]